MGNSNNSSSKSIKEIAPDIAPGAINVSDVVTYLAHYIIHYKIYYYKYFTAPPPQGAGYPLLNISPYYFQNNFTCYLANDGAVIAVYTGLEDETPDFLPKPKNTAIIDQGRFIPRDSNQQISKEDLTIKTKYYDISLKELVTRLTRGFLSYILNDERIIQQLDSSFWNPITVRNLWLGNQELNEGRDYYYMEILFHVDKAAWDIRNILIRVFSDIRRDFALTIANYGNENPIITYGTSFENLFYERLNELNKTIDEFQLLLDDSHYEDESIFHDFLKRHPILLDVYGESFKSKPRFIYPEAESPLGKERVEPDFIIRYPNNIYKIIELEKPSKDIATQKGHTSVGVTQAAWQIA
jgi:hypothetical protein